MAPWNTTMSHTKLPSSPLTPPLPCHFGRVSVWSSCRVAGGTDTLHIGDA